MNKLKIGCHLSSSDGYLAMAKKIVEMGGNTFAFFTRNPRGGSIKPLDLEDIRKFNEYRKEHGIDYLVAHAPYTMNLASKDDSTRAFGISVLKDDLSRLQHVEKTYYNFHPGSHVGQGFEVGAEKIVSALNECLKEEQTTMVLFECMAGKGSEIGKTFEEIKYLMDRVLLKDHIGVCLDTCHIFDGGYDIVDHLDDVLDEFDRIIGLEHLKAIHLNDSMNVMNSHKDRHQKIGLGNIGLDALVRVINHPKLRDLPFILETPNEEEGYIQEISLLKAKYN